ncbi:DUF1376 domain-containing protein [Rhodocista pekingensis]|uniref:DUF1376 domain-containing protein n=1 Tax=Rhodocista pekingensis TaxID=201185 RepID=A0ABW2KUT3_9PROT
MAEFPALPLWTDAYLGDTTHLTTIEHGAYLLLLMAMWRTPDCSLPDEDKLLARYARLTPGQWARMKPTLMAFFRQKDGRVYQGRLTDEHNLVRQNSKRQSDRARSRWLKNKENADATAMPEACRNDASHTHTHYTVETNVSTGAAAPPDPDDHEAEAFRLGRQIIGPKSGGQVAKLNRHHAGDWAATVRTLHLAATKSEPAAYIGAVVRGERHARAAEVLAETDALYRQLGVI